MRMADGGFEYWIGMFLPQDAPVPEGYEHMDLPEEDCALFWIYGSESSGELYSMSAEALCQAEPLVLEGFASYELRALQVASSENNYLLS